MVISRVSIVTMGLSTWLNVVDDVMLQRWHTRHLPSDPRAVCGADVEGKTFVVTGPTSGIGTTTAETLARKGARVILACRTVKRGRDLVEAWNREARAEGVASPLDCEVMHLDLDSLDSVRAFCKEFIERDEPLHCLVNNAGVFDMSGAHTWTKDGHESHYGTNFLAPALLSVLLMPALKRAGTAAAPARIVFVCSKLHEFCTGLKLGDLNFESRRYSARAAYAQSKLAELLFIRELEYRLGVEKKDKNGNEKEQRHHVRAFAVHPGNIITGVVRTLPVLVQYAYKIIMGAILLTPSEGARASLYAATRAEALEVKGVAPYFTSECVAKQPSKAALDDKAATALWTNTLDKLGIDPSWKP